MKLHPVQDKYALAVGQILRGISLCMPLHVTSLCVRARNQKPEGMFCMCVCDFVCVCLCD